MRKTVLKSNGWIGKFYRVHRSKIEKIDVDLVINNVSRELEFDSGLMSAMKNVFFTVVIKLLD